jgi:hypothetical protein
LRLFLADPRARRERGTTAAWLQAVHAAPAWLPSRKGGARNTRRWLVAACQTLRLALERNYGHCMSGAAFGCSLRKAAFPLECGHAPVMLVAKVANDFGLAGRTMAIMQPRTHPSAGPRKRRSCGCTASAHGPSPMSTRPMIPARSSSTIPSSPPAREKQATYKVRPGDRDAKGSANTLRTHRLRTHRRRSCWSARFVWATVFVSVP